MMDSEGYGTVNHTYIKSACDRGTNGDEFERTPLVGRSDHVNDATGPNIFSKLVFNWFSPILFRGNEKQRLDPDDLELVPLPADCRTEETANRFELCWKQELKENPSNPSLLKSLFRAFGMDYVVAGLFQFFHDCCIFVGPQVLRGMIGYLQSPAGTGGRSVWDGVGLTAAVACSQIIMSLCLRHYFFKCHTTGLRIRTSVIVAVYKKALLLASGEIQKRSQGEISNLVSIDAERLQDLMDYGHSVWSSPFQIVVSMLFLWRELGPSSLGGVAVIIAMIPVSGKLSEWMGILQEEVMKATDDRTTLNSEVLSNMKVIKIQAWEESFQNRILSLRDFELKRMLQYCTFAVLSNSMWILTPLVVSLATFACYVISGHTLDVASALTSLALFEILRFPLFMLPMIINHIVEAMVSIKRIRSFLLCDEHRPVDADNLKSSVVQLDFYNATYESMLKSSDQGNGKNELHETNIQISLQRSRLDDAENELKLIEHGNSVLITSEEQNLHEENIPNLLCLHQVNFECKPGEFVAIVGSVGSGKSSLINAILGEVKQISGSAAVNGSLAYFSQTPFIQNASVRDNIIFGHLQEPVNEDLYQRCLDCCALRHDLNLLTDGDKTEIGEKGITLSGGQKARVALARAVYHQGDVTLVDDALSAVDAHVASHLFEKALVGELMRPSASGSGSSNNRGVVLVTNNIQLLSNPRINRIVVIQDGKIVEEGNYSTLVQSGSSVFSRMISMLENTNISEFNKVEGAEMAMAEDDAELYNFEVLNEGTKQPRKSLMTEEIREKGHVDISVYLVWAKAAGGVIVPLSVVLSYAVNEIVSVLSNWWLSHWSANNASGKSQYYFLAIYGFITVSAAVLDIFSTSILTYFGLRASRKLFSDMLAVVLHAKMSFFDTTPIGRLVNRFTEDINKIDSELPETMISFLFTFFEVLSTIAVIVAITPIFAICLIPITILYFSEQSFFTMSYRELKRLNSVAMSPIYAFLNEAVGGAAVIRAFKAQSCLLARLTSILDKQQHAYYLTFAAECWLDIRLEMMGTLIIVFACLSAVAQHHFFGTNAAFAGLAGLSISYSFSVTESLHWMIRMAIELEGSMVAVERVREYTKLENEGARITTIDETLPLNWPASGEITFKSAKLRYRDELPLALKGLDLVIPPGSKVGVVGRTGAGKSTLMVALMRIVELCDGQILIDGIDSRTVGLTKLRNNIAVIPQDPVLFSGTIRSNVDPFDEYTDDAISNVLDQVGLIKAKSISSSIYRAPLLGNARLESLDDVVNEGGTNFSVGQRQLLVIARALLQGAKIVLMDEATASIDAETDVSIQKVLRHEFADSTCITVAHRLNTIMDSDYILVMDNGKAAEFDTPSNLLQKQGMFYNLVQAARFD